MAVARKPNRRANFRRATRFPDRGLRILRVAGTILIMKIRAALFASAPVQKLGEVERLIRLSARATYYYRRSGPVLARADERVTLRKCLWFWFDVQQRSRREQEPFDVRAHTRTMSRVKSDCRSMRQGWHLENYLRTEQL